MDPNELQDLMSGTNEWLNIQLILRSTFHTFHDLVTGQNERIRNLEEVVAKQHDAYEVLKQEFEAQRNIVRAVELQLADKFDNAQAHQVLIRAEDSVKRNVENFATEYASFRRAVSDKLDRVSSQIETKVSADVLRSILDDRDRAQRQSTTTGAQQHLETLVMAIKNKPDRSEVEDMLKDRHARAENEVNNKLEMFRLAKLEPLLAQLRGDVDMLQQEIGRKVSLNNLDDYVTHRFEAMRSGYDSLHRGLRQLQLAKQLSRSPTRTGHSSPPAMSSSGLAASAAANTGTHNPNFVSAMAGLEAVRYASSSGPGTLSASSSSSSLSSFRLGK
jgi:hypothetical protein